MTTSDRNPVGRAFAILQWMAENDRTDTSVSEIAAGVGMLLSTTHRVLAMLENEDLVSQNSNRGRYTLGIAFHRLARTAAVRASIREIVQPHVEEIRNLTGETCWFATVDTRSSTMMFRAAAESPHLLRVVRPLDEEISIFRAGAVGRVGLAYLQEEDLDRALQSPDAHFNAEQFQDQLHWRDHLKEIRKKGFEVSTSTTTGGMGVAAAVVSNNDRLLGVLGIGLPANRSTPEKEELMINLVCTRAVALASAF